MLGQFFRRIYVRAPEPIPKEHRSLLLLVGAAYFIAGYDVNIYGLAAKQIQASFAIPEENIGIVIAIFRLGVIPALALAYLADRIGRRNLLMITLAGAAVTTVWTAFAQTLTEFIVAQTIARIFIYAEEILCMVVIAEEFSERTRGWAAGQLGALGALGAGAAALVFALVDLLPYGWRAIYALGAIPLLWLLWARRALPETRRFRERAKDGAVKPLVSLMRNYPHRLLLLIGLCIMFGVAVGTAVPLASSYLQGTHKWLPWQVSALTIGAGFVAILGTTTAGALSDKYGRRKVIAISVLVKAFSFALFFSWASGPWLVLFWTTGLFALLAADVLIASLGAELFPTSHRSLAAATRFMASLFGGVLGFVVERELFHFFGSHGPAVASLAILAPLCLLPLLLLPEPAQKKLEEISGERP
ncbi:MAG: MFS transporter [Alphaproteobacteria bacterium]|nr:MFS transporter [Alphaproteobacteria bacterium]